MNPAISCIEDTLRLLLEEAKHAKEAMLNGCGIVLYKEAGKVSKAAPAVNSEQVAWFLMKIRHRAKADEGQTPGEDWNTSLSTGRRSPPLLCIYTSVHLRWHSALRRRRSASAPRRRTALPLREARSPQ